MDDCVLYHVSPFRLHQLEQLVIRHRLVYLVFFLVVGLAQVYQVYQVDRVQAKVQAEVQAEVDAKKIYRYLCVVS